MPLLSNKTSHIALFIVTLLFLFAYIKVGDDLGPINSLKVKGRHFQAEGPIQKRV